jgi:hypothetical protein
MKRGLAKYLKLSVVEHTNVNIKVGIHNQIIHYILPLDAFGTTYFLY